MSIRRPVLFVCLLLLVATALLIWFARKSSDTPPQASNAVAQSNAIQLVTAPANRSQPQSSGASSPTNATTPPSASVVSVPAPETRQDMREGLARLNDEEVVLYGRVIDQFNTPVAGATVAGSIQVNNGTRVGVDRLSLTTDASGQFTISGYKGKTLGVMISKAGYALATKDTSFVYSRLWPESERHVPDARNPVIFKMWKLQGAEPLATINQRFKVPGTDAPIYFDILAGTVVPSGGDIKITVARSPGVVSQQNPQDWGFQIGVVDGGLIETSMAEARATYEAPTGGYMPTYNVAVSTTNHWSDLVQRMFFVQSRNGKVFSKLLLSFDINAKPDDPISITFRGIANANGSRNWEGDPNTMKPQ